MLRMLFAIVIATGALCLAGAAAAAERLDSTVKSVRIHVEKE